MREAQERRVLAAVVFIDAATQRPIAGVLKVEAAGLRFHPNRRGLYVVHAARGFRAHTQSFEIQPAGGPQSFSGTVIDPSGRYLPRQFSLDLLRSADPNLPDAPGSVFRPVEVALFTSPSARVEGTWAVFRAVLRDDQDRPVPGALVRLTPQLPAARAVEGMSQLGFDPLTQRPLRTVGELMIPLPDIPVMTWGQDDDEDVLLNSVSVTVEIRLATVGQGAPTPPVTLSIPDPVALAARPPMRLGVNQNQFDVVSGQTLRAGVIELLPPLP